MGDEQLETHLEQPDVAGQLPGELLGGGGIGYVQRRADPVHCPSFPPPSRTAACARATTSPSATSSKSFPPRCFHSTLPSARPFLPMAMRRGRPIRSASLNFTPA